MHIVKEMINHSWQPFQKDLTCVGSLICRFFSIVNTTIPHDLKLVDSTDLESRIQRNCGYEG